MYILRILGFLLSDKLEALHYPPVVGECGRDLSISHKIMQEYADVRGVRELVGKFIYIR